MPKYKKKILCFLLGHEFRTWHYVPETEFKLRVCSRCGLEKHMLVWSDERGTRFEGTFYFKGED